MNPPLEDIQRAINECAKKMLTISKALVCWGQPEVQTYHELLSADKEVVKSILRLTGSVEGIKHQVRARARLDTSRPGFLDPATSSLLHPPRANSPGRGGHRLRLRSAELAGAGARACDASPPGTGAARGDL